MESQSSCLVAQVAAVQDPVCLVDLLPWLSSPTKPQRVSFQYYTNNGQITHQPSGHWEHAIFIKYCRLDVFQRETKQMEELSAHSFTIPRAKKLHSFQWKKKGFNQGILFSHLNPKRVPKSWMMILQMRSSSHKQRTVSTNSVHSYFHPNFSTTLGQQNVS